METSDIEALRKTPLCETHIAMGAKMAPFGGWLMPIQYEGILAEHAHTRRAVSVFDICHMGEFRLEADPVSSGLDRIVTQSILSMPIGSCRYGFMLNEKGGVIDDLVVYRLGKASWMLVVNAATIAGDEAHLRAHLSGRYDLDNISEETGKLDIQGPRSPETLEHLFGVSVKKLAYYTFGKFDLGGKDVIVSRTGYTGEVGYEVYISADSVTRLWKHLFEEDERIKPAGLGCRDTLRLEMGYPLYGQDLDADHTPLEAGFERFVDLKKDFIGKAALIREREEGIKERLVCFGSDTRRSPRHGFAIFSGASRIGTVTSGSFSPSLLTGIGMGYVSGSLKAGDKLLTKDKGTEIAVTVVNKPFYGKERTV
ncbi:MAG: glycine cleavage system aminomethyltransferase GcvT [Candidatus Omnitrophica bacterium]|nr:glycine cleavage system aminomethyltransferase GcvT [Candidatus Omnitrophota bacterium]